MTITVERIFQLMKIGNMQQKEMAELLGTSPSVLSDWKSVKRNLSPSFEQIKAIADHFNVTTDYLLGRTNHPNVEVVPADPEKVRAHADQLEQQRKESYGKLVEAIKKLPPDGEQSVSAEDMELARRLNSLSPDNRARALDYLDLLEKQDSK